MIKLTLTGANPGPFWVNPSHLIWFMGRNGGAGGCTVRTVNGDQYSVVEAGETIALQMEAYQNRSRL